MSNGWLSGGKPTGNFWRDHSLSIVIAAILAAQTIYCLWSGHWVWVDDQQTHQQKPASGWPSDFWIWWTWEYFLSVVADTYGVILIVLLSKWLREVGSSESNDS